MIEALFILFILQFSNYMPNILGDKPIPGKINSLLTGDIYVLNIMLLFLIYFSVKGIEDTENNIYTKLKNTFIIWIIYLIYIKLPLNFNIIVFIEFLCLYLLDEYNTHHLHVEHNEFMDKNIDNIRNFLKILIGITMAIGLYIKPPKIKQFKDILKNM